MSRSLHDTKSWCWWRPCPVVTYPGSRDISAKPGPLLSGSKNPRTDLWILVTWHSRGILHFEKLVLFFFKVNAPSLILYASRHECQSLSEPVSHLEDEQLHRHKQSTPKLRQWEIMILAAKVEADHYSQHLSIVFSQPQLFSQPCHTKPGLILLMFTQV